MLSHSAGILPFRHKGSVVEVFLGHPGGLYWKEKDEGAWTILKGIVEDSEKLLDAARREFSEETSFVVDGNFIELGSSPQSDKKMNTIFALEGDLDATKAYSNLCEFEWPEGSGNIEKCPEIDRFEWFPLCEAMIKIQKGQREFIVRLASLLGHNI